MPSYSESPKPDLIVGTLVRQKPKWWVLVGGILGILMLVIVATFAYIWQQITTPPSNFPVNQPLIITPGSSAKAIAKELEEASFVNSAFIFYWYLVLEADPTAIKAGRYLFSTGKNMPQLATAFIQGDTTPELIKFTHIEGERVSLLAKRAAAALPNFDHDAFIEMAKSSEGFLYPDTYFVPPSFNSQQLFDLLNRTYTERLEPLRPDIARHQLSEKEIIILASIIEREANTESSMRMVSGILQNRLKIGMALQADATMEYILDKPLSELTASDLRDIDSPYNTYLYPGLPPTPIGNPGLTAIKAVLEPTPSPYLFYITGSDGNFYYAENFDQHRLNIARYLR